MQSSDFHLYRVDETEDVEELHEPDAQAPELPEVEKDAFDELLLTEPTLIKDGQEMKANIIGRKCDNKENLVGNFNSNPLLNKQIY